MVWYWPTTWFEDTGMQKRTSYYRVVECISESRDRREVEFRSIAPFQEYFFVFPSKMLKYYAIGKGKTKQEAIEDCRRNIKNNIPIKKL